MKLIFALIISLCLTTTLFSQYSDRKWVDSTSSPSGSTDDRAFKIVTDGSGNTFVTGQAHHSHLFYGIMTAKYDANGSQLWVSSYSASGNNNDSATGIALDASGNVYVCGKHFNGTSFEYVVIKYNGSDGSQLWTSGYTATQSGGDAIPTGIVIEEGTLTTPNVYVTGYSYESYNHSVEEGPNYDMVTIKINALTGGAPIWVNRFDAPDEPNEGKIKGHGDDKAFAIGIFNPATLPANTRPCLYICGYSYHYFFNNGSPYDKNNNIIVQISLSAAELAPLYSYYNEGDITNFCTDEGLTVAVSQLTDKVYYSGYKHKDNSSNVDLFLLQNKYGLHDDNGHQTEDWCATYVDNLESNNCFWNFPDFGDDAGSSLAIVDSDNPNNIVIYVCGSTHTIPIDSLNSSATNGSDFITIRYHGTRGNPPCFADAYPFDFKIVHGMRTPVLSLYDGSAHGDDYANSITIGPGGNVFVTGTSHENAGTRSVKRFTTIQYTPDLDQNWVDSYPRSTDLNDFNADAEGFGITADNNYIYATGYSFSPTTGNNFTTIKYGLPGVNNMGKPGNVNSPFSYSLAQNYPNPFNPMTEINYSLRFSGLVKIVVYDILGKEAALLVNGEMEAGSHTVKWDASNYASGVYFYKISAGSFSDTKKLLLLK